MRRKLTEAVNRGWFSYLTIFLLQLKIVWGMWRFRDLTSGDTSSYFITAYDWYRNWHLLITWSPLYTSFYGTLLHILSDAYFVTILHRLLIVLALAVLVLALMRQLLPPGLAWLMAAWWVVLPIDFNALYEVHLFAVIPVVVALLAIRWRPGPWGRGWGVAILFAATILMRNELFIATVLFAVISLGWDVRQVRKDAVVGGSALAKAYAVPLVTACLLITLYCLRSTDIPMLRQMLARKHTLNMCQTYAFGYQQRYSDWKGSPWTDCQQLMSKVYGLPEPSLREALRLNTGAMLEHFRWNIRLIPNGIQVLLFSAMWGTVTPDYIPVPSRSVKALVASLLLGAVVAVGLLMLYRDRKFWWDSWMNERIWTWAAMACVAVPVFAVILTQRPRPSYMFALGILLRAVAGMCLFALGSHWSQIKRVASAMPVLMLLLILAAPAYYSVSNPDAPRHLFEAYRRLAPFQRRLEKPNSGLVSPGWSWELCSYLGKSNACRALSFSNLRNEVRAGTDWAKVLDEHGATLFYADDAVIADSLGSEFVRQAASYGWQTIDVRNEPGNSWAVLEKTSVSSSAAGLAIRDIVLPNSGILLGDGWHALEYFEGQSFRWVNNDAGLMVRRPQWEPLTVLVTLEAGPGLSGRPLFIQVYSDGHLLERIAAPGRSTIKVMLPSGATNLRLHVDSPNHSTPNDARILNFRVFQVAVL